MQTEKKETDVVIWKKKKKKAIYSKTSSSLYLLVLRLSADINEFFNRSNKATNSTNCLCCINS